MSSDFDRAFAMWDAARPTSGFRPETPEEWRRVLRANEEMGYAMFRVWAPVRTCWFSAGLKLHDR
jgi:hypothetical protein